MSGERIGQVLGRTGTKPPDHAPEVVAEVRGLWLQGLSQRQIAEHVGISLGTVSGLRHRYFRGER